jgi:hypothetical protein
MQRLTVYCLNPSSSLLRNRLASVARGVLSTLSQKPFVAKGAKCEVSTA